MSCNLLAARVSLNLCEIGMTCYLLSVLWEVKVIYPCEVRGSCYLYEIRVSYYLCEVRVRYYLCEVRVSCYMYEVRVSCYLCEVRVSGIVLQQLVHHEGNNGW